MPARHTVISRRLFSWLGLAAALGGCLAQSGCQPPEAPEQHQGRLHDWERLSPEDAGFNPRKLDRAIAWFDAKGPGDGADKLVVVRRDQPVWVGSRAEEMQEVLSCTKVFTTMVMGMLVDRGFCQTDTRIAEVLPELGELYPEATLGQFASMTSGYQAADDMTAAGSYRHGPSPQWQIPGPPLFPPGTRFAYWDSAVNQLGRALTHLAGESMQEVFRDTVADPIGMNPEQWRWGLFERLEDGRINGGAGNRRRGVEISAIELARFGQLLLDGGEWKGRRLISSDWIAEATSVQVPADLPLGGPLAPEKGMAAFPFEGRGVFGYGWWVNGRKADGKRQWPDLPECAFATIGFHNNALFVIPKLDLVVARLGTDQRDRNITQKDYNDFLRRVTASIAAERS